MEARVFQPRRDSPGAVDEDVEPLVFAAGAVFVGDEADIQCFFAARVFWFAARDSGGAVGGEDAAVDELDLVRPAEAPFEGSNGRSVSTVGR